MNTSDIIKYARSFKTVWHTTDPYEIAEKYGIRVFHCHHAIKDFTAHTIKAEGYPTVIAINDSYTDFSKKLLCAHELGHSLLHNNGVNHFSLTSKNANTNVELEANLFAIALLSDEEFDNKLNMPLDKLNNYLLKTIMDFNLKKKDDGVSLDS